MESHALNGYLEGASTSDVLSPRGDLLRDADEAVLPHGEYAEDGHPSPHHAEGRGRARRDEQAVERCAHGKQ